MLRILMATDLSAAADLALSRAISLASANGAALRVVHAPEDATTDAERAGLRQQLLARVNAEAPPDLQVGVALLSGPPVAAILEDAGMFEPDLIVLGGHREMRLRDTLFGTTATQILARTKAPMLVARAGGGFPYGRVLAALDATEAAEKVLRLAVRIAGVHDVFVVHAFPGVTETLPEDGGMAGDRETIEQIVREVAGRVASVRVHVDIEEGDTFRVLETAVTQLEPNLLVLGTRGRRGLARFLSGSLAEEALAYFDLDILVLRTDEGEILEQELPTAFAARERAGAR